VDKLIGLTIFLFATFRESFSKVDLLRRKERKEKKKKKKREKSEKREKREKSLNS
jgi:hypothetical protein